MIHILNLVFEENNICMIKLATLVNNGMCADNEYNFESE